MAYYAYKHVRDLLPQHIIDMQGPDYEGNGNYDGDQWYAAEDYILELIAQRDALTAERDALRAEVERLKNSGLCKVEKCIALEAERDALKSQLDGYTVMMTARCDALAAKVELLRAALKGAVESTHAWGYFDVAKARAALEATK